MKRIVFNCELLTDAVISQNTATEGSQRTLDFIPGNNFLGIVAGKMYSKLNGPEQYSVFHSGNIHFGDAHPLLKGKRSVRIPSSWFTPKDSKQEGIYIRNFGESPDIQLEQMRNTFIVVNDDHSYYKAEIEKSFAIKSAYDSSKRKSENAMMYGYQSLKRGGLWQFEIVFNDLVSDALINNVKQCLEGKVSIGRSKTAQYGSINITVHSDVELVNPHPVKYQQSYVLIYADARLIFFDDFGQLTLRPKDVGLKTGRINWEKSFIRTFQYAPWNGRRQARDADRCGIEKGSVFYVENIESELPEIMYVGEYQNEGFGKVLINPPFFQCDPVNGKSAYYCEGKLPVDVNASRLMDNSTLPETDSLLLAYLRNKKVNTSIHDSIYNNVNRFVTDFGGKFKGESFASQWGTIRSLAYEAKDMKTLRNMLFDENGYLYRGVTAMQWEKAYRRDVFEHFFNQQSKIEAIINLATEMAKLK